MNYEDSCEAFPSKDISVLVNVFVVVFVPGTMPKISGFHFHSMNQFKALMLTYAISEGEGNLT